EGGLQFCRADIAVRMTGTPFLETVLRRAIALQPGLTALVVLGRLRADAVFGTGLAMVVQARTLVTVFTVLAPDLIPVRGQAFAFGHGCTAPQHECNQGEAKHAGESQYVVVSVPLGHAGNSQKILS